VGACVEYPDLLSREAAMRTLTERGRHFHAHPLQATFSPIASMLLAALVVLALVLSAR